TRSDRDWSSDVCSSDLTVVLLSGADRGSVGPSPGQQGQGRPADGLRRGTWTVQRWLGSYRISLACAARRWRWRSRRPPLPAFPRSEERRVGEAWGPEWW